MTNQQSPRVNQIVELMVAEIEARIREQKPDVRPEQPPGRPEAQAARTPDGVRSVQSLDNAGLAVEPDLGSEAGTESSIEVAAAADQDANGPPFRGAPHAARLMGRLAIGVLAAVIVVNIPFTRHGTRLATAMPDRTSVVIHEGSVVKEEDDDEIYVFQDGHFRWISSLDAFEHLGYTWGDVVVREDGFLEPYRIGPPIHVLLKCHGSPHVYRLESGAKRWIVNIATFEAEGHVWEDVRMVSCPYLRELPDGETIPPDHGPPPQP